MATVTFASMVNDISPSLPGVPSLVIERYARKVATDLCQRAKVWRGDATPFALVVGQAEYTPVSAVAYGEFVDFLDGYTIVDTTKHNLVYTDYALVRRLYPAWPEDDEGQPQYATRKIPGELLLAPTPEAVGTAYIYGLLRPTATADIWEEGLYREFQRAIFHGVLFEVYSLPKYSWTDAKLAEAHGKIWTFLLNQARDRAERGYNTSSLAVQMRPFA